MVKPHCFGFWLCFSDGLGRPWRLVPRVSRNRYSVEVIIVSVCDICTKHGFVSVPLKRKKIYISKLDPHDNAWLLLKHHVLKPEPCCSAERLSRSRRPLMSAKVDWKITSTYNAATARGKKLQEQNEKHDWNRNPDLNVYALKIAISVLQYDKTLYM